MLPPDSLIYELLTDEKELDKALKYRPNLPTRLLAGYASLEILKQNLKNKRNLTPLLDSLKHHPDLLLALFEITEATAASEGKDALNKALNEKMAAFGITLEPEGKHTSKISGSHKPLSFPSQNSTTLAAWLESDRGQEAFTDPKNVKLLISNPAFGQALINEPGQAMLKALLRMGKKYYAHAPQFQEIIEIIELTHIKDTTSPTIDPEGGYKKIIVGHREQEYTQGTQKLRDLRLRKAMAEYSLEKVSAMLDAGVDPNVPGDDGKTSLDVAYDMGWHDVITLMKKATGKKEEYALHDGGDKRGR